MESIRNKPLQDPHAPELWQKHLYTHLPIKVATRQDKKGIRHVFTPRKFNNAADLFKKCNAILPIEADTLPSVKLRYSEQDGTTVLISYTRKNYLITILFDENIFLPILRKSDGRYKWKGSNNQIDSIGDLTCTSPELIKQAFDLIYSS